MKMFAVIDETNTVVDGWIADSFEEAQADNLNKTIIEVTLKNTPIPYKGKWNGKQFYS